MRRHTTTEPMTSGEPPAVVRSRWTCGKPPATNRLLDDVVAHQCGPEGGRTRTTNNGGPIRPVLPVVIHSAIGQCHR